MYPEQSNFRSSEPRSAWWYVRVPGDPERNICHDSGSGFLASLQAWLAERVRRSPAHHVQGLGITVEPSQIPQKGEGGWNVAVLQAMYGVISLDAHAFALPGIERSLYFDLRDKKISRETLRLAIWLLTQSSSAGGRAGQAQQAFYNQGSPLDISLPYDVVLPKFGELMPLIGTDANKTRTGLPEIELTSNCNPTPYWTDKNRSHVLTHPLMLAGQIAAIIAGSLLLGEQTLELDGPSPAKARTGSSGRKARPATSRRRSSSRRRRSSRGRSRRSA